MYDGKPPCGECEKPTWDVENILAWDLWLMVNKRDRPVSFNGPLPLSTQSVLNLCELYDASIEDFEKILEIDDIIFPKLNAKEEEGGGPAKKSGNKVRHPQTVIKQRSRPIKRK